VPNLLLLTLAYKKLGLDFSGVTDYATNLPAKLASSEWAPVLLGGLGEPFLGRTASGELAPNLLGIGEIGFIFAALFFAVRGQVTVPGDRMDKTI